MRIPEVKKHGIGVDSRLRLLAQPVAPPGALLRWEQNFANPKVGTPTLITDMQTPGALANGSRTGYGFGLEIGDYRGQRVIQHGGNDRGISSSTVRYSDQGLSIVVLCNLDSIPAPMLTQQIADIYLSDVLIPLPPHNAVPDATSKVTLAARALSDKTGLYRDASGDEALNIAVRNGTLVAHNYYGDDFDVELVPVNTSSFRWPNSSVLVEFTPTPDRELECRITNEGRVLERYQRSALAPSPNDLQALAGDYTSPELDVTYRLEVRESGLLVKAPKRPDIMLRPLASDMFAGSSMGTVKVLRDPSGAVTGFTLNRLIVREIRFDRMKRAR